MSIRRVTAPGRVVGVQRAEHDVPGERGLHRGLGGLLVADLAHHDRVGVVPQDRPEPRREGQPDLGVHLDLVHARHVVLDRVLDGDALDLVADDRLSDA
jgi:hypothetical protein